MLDKKTFTVGIGMISTLISDHANHMKTSNSYKLLFNELSDLDPRFFIQGISEMLKNEDIKFFPSVYTIRKYVEAASRNNYSVEELLDMAKVRELTKKPFSNPYIDYLVSNIDSKKSSINKLEFKSTEPIQGEVIEYK